MHPDKPNEKMKQIPSLLLKTFKNFEIRAFL